MKPLTPLPRLMLGDNQFFGVNHMSEDRAAQQLIKFQRIESIMEVLRTALDLGITTFMCTTHDRVAQICDIVRADPQTYGELRIQPCMPYAHKYVNSITEEGLIRAIRTYLPPEGFLNAALRGTKSLASRDIDGIATLLVDAEMRMLHDIPTPVIWMQNVVVDLLVGMRMHDALRLFAEHVGDRYGVQPGFITMNLPQTLDALDACGIENPVVCANMNKIGFRMSGGLDAYKRALAERPFRAVAMSVFASGAIPAREALEWVCEQPTIESVVFGASGRSTMASTVALMDELWAGPGLLEQGGSRLTTEGSG